MKIVIGVVLLTVAVLILTFTEMLEFGVLIGMIGWAFLTRGLWEVSGES